MDDLDREAFGPLSDEAWVYPGHGKETTLSAERPRLPQWQTRGRWGRRLRHGGAVPETRRATCAGQGEMVICVPSGSLSASPSEPMSGSVLLPAS